MTVEAIHLGDEGVPELWPVESVSAVAGQGLEGDRHFHPEGAKPGQALTLVDAAEVERVGLPPGATRRQVTSSSAARSAWAIASRCQTPLRASARDLAP